MNSIHRPFRVVAYSSWILVIFLLAPQLWAGETVSVAADQALKRLLEGNQRYVQAAASSAKPLASRRKEIAKSQHPFAVIVGCSDSRVAPEIVFDENLGDLFVIRVAGNLVDRFELGSIEYAVEHLGVRLIVVLGHERCGAVGAAVQGGEAHGHIGTLVHAIVPSVQKVQAEKGDLLENAIRENARRVGREIAEQSPSLSKQAKQGEIRIVEAYYDLDTGVVSLIDAGGQASE